MSQAINLRALRWAYALEGLSVTAKAVLLTFAVHANERGYTWPSVERIASTWGMDRETVRRQIKTLVVRRKLCRTKKHRGSTGQVKVYRLPKITWGSGGKSTRLQNNGSGDQAGHKRGISGGKSTPNKEQGTQHSLKRATHHSLARDGGGFEGEEFLSEEQREAVRDFNTTLVPLGFKPVTKLSAGLEKVLEKFDAESVRWLVTEAFVESDDVFIPKRKTLVRLCWANLL